MSVVVTLGGQNWLITPAALAVNEPPPASIYEQKWLFVLSGVAIAGLQGSSSSQWLDETVLVLPDLVAGLTWAISQYGIPQPSGKGPYSTRFAVDEWAPYAALGAILDQNGSTAGFAVNDWRPFPFTSATDIITDQTVTQIFNGIEVDLATRNTDAQLCRFGYHITLRGRIVFTVQNG